MDDSRLVGWQLALTRGDLSIDVLGRVVEVISGQTLDEFLRTRIFEPLGMVDTGFSVPAEQTGRLAALYGAHPATSLAVPLAAAGASVLQPPSAHLGGGRCDS